MSVIIEFHPVVNRLRFSVTNIKNRELHLFDSEALECLFTQIRKSTITRERSSSFFWVKLKFSRFQNQKKSENAFISIF